MLLHPYCYRTKKERTDPGTSLDRVDFELDQKREEMTIDSHLTRAPLHKILINIYNQNRGVGGGPFDKYAVSIAY